MGVYLAYGLFVGLRGRSHTGILGLLALFGDTVYFLIVASSGSEPMWWLASGFFLYLLTEALVAYSTVEVVVIGAVSAVFCAVFPGAWIMERTVVVGGVIACGFAATVRRQTLEIAKLKDRVGEVERAAEKAGENERVRIASDFHDGPLQSFISFQMRLEILRKRLERDFEAGMNELKELQLLAVTQVRD